MTDLVKLPPLPPHLVAAVKDNRAVLLLGAGASVGSQNKYGRPIKPGKELAKLICERSAQKYS